MTSARPVPLPALRRIAQAATKAPSMHNTQPWRWRATASSLELHVDASRRLPETDAHGRNMIISCGAALHHARTAAVAMGWEPVVTRYPDASTPDLLARLDLLPGRPTDHARELLEAIEARCTDRRRFTAWPVPEERLAQLAALATEQGTLARPLTDVMERVRAERIVARAAVQQAAQRVTATEGSRWLDRSATDGIPRAAAGSTGDPGGRSTRFAPVIDGSHEDQDLECCDGLILLFDGHDDPGSWLRAGEGLSAMWLTATVQGLSIVPLSQVIDVETARTAFRHDVMHDLGHPLLLVRVGWQAIGRSELERTPRRPLDEVFEVDAS